MEKRRYCIKSNCLYESRDYHNAVFIGFDRHGVPRYGTQRGTSARRYMVELNGSDKHFSFSISTRNGNCKLHLFKSAVDLLSYGTLELLSGRDWLQQNYLSLAGIYKPEQKIEESTPPAALIQFLNDHQYINNIALHLDNDTAGRLAAKTIQTILSSKYTVTDEPPKWGKDCNDYLKTVLGLRQLSSMER
ncbi:toprim domain-containing protein [Petroclostridium sp. X23]|uniref:toprim domain-containing protein n=1 Tax=Petroclostridium sp. X23 TaxID=3045146 RepID=UPI0024ACDE76|nr:toprim domain-containing protein [Petroclostridium sp. X23]WHH60067.1 toprim domain-containing protein [Petroclostridium sp. X23]